MKNPTTPTRYTATPTKGKGENGKESVVECFIEDLESRGASETFKFSVPKPLDEISLMDIKQSYFSMGKTIGIFQVKTFERDNQYHWTVVTDDSLFIKDLIRDFTVSAPLPPSKASAAPKETPKEGVKPEEKTAEPSNAVASAPGTANPTGKEGQDPFLNNNLMQMSEPVFMNLFASNPQNNPENFNYANNQTENPTPNGSSQNQQPLKQETDTRSADIYLRVKPILPRKSKRYIKKGEPGYKRPKPTYVKKGQPGYKRPRYYYKRKTPMTKEEEEKEKQMAQQQNQRAPQTRSNQMTPSTMEAIQNLHENLQQQKRY